MKSAESIARQIVIIYKTQTTRDENFLEELIAQALREQRKWPTQKEIDDAYVKNADRAASCRSWRAGIAWLKDWMTRGDV